MIGLTKEQALSFISRLELGEEFNEAGFTFKGETLRSIIPYDGITEDGHITNDRRFSVEVMGHVQNYEEITFSQLEEELNLEK